MDWATFNDATDLSRSIYKLNSIIEIMNRNEELAIEVSNGYRVFLTPSNIYHSRIIKALKKGCESLLEEMEGQFEDL